MDLTAAASPSIPHPTPPSTTRNNEARDAIEVDRIYLRNNLRLYIREAWHVVEPSTVYLENWHIDLIAEYLEAVTAGQIKRLLINMPPRYAKSTCVSIMWPTWVWAREPFPGKPHNPAIEALKCRNSGLGRTTPRPVSVFDERGQSVAPIYSNPTRPTRYIAAQNTTRHA